MELRNKKIVRYIHHTESNAAKRRKLDPEVTDNLHDQIKEEDVQSEYTQEEKKEEDAEQKEEDGEQKEEDGEQKEENAEQKEEDDEQKEEDDEQKEEDDEQKEEDDEQKEEDDEQKGEENTESEEEIDDEQLNLKIFTDFVNVMSSIYGKDDDDSLMTRKNIDIKLNKYEWYTLLNKSEQEYYIDRFQSMLKRSGKIPSIKVILDSDFPKSDIRSLINDIFKLDNIDSMTTKYTDLHSKIIARYKFLKKNSEQCRELQKIEKRLLNKEYHTNDLKERILLSKLPDNIRTLLYNRYMMSQSLSEESKSDHEEWIRKVLKLPTETKVIQIRDDIPKREAIGEKLKELKSEFDKHIYGFENIKENMLIMVASILNNPNSKNKLISLAGPPGIGKTLLISILSKVLDIPFRRISLGGVDDVSYLNGHSFTYVGSQEGIIVKYLSEMGYTNGILYFDEIDKVGRSHNSSDGVNGTLLTITDATQNNKFDDKYLDGIPIDLSNLIIATSMNDENEVNPILLDRIKPIYKFKGYNRKGKIELVTNFLHNEICDNLKIPNNDVIITKDIASYIIKKIEGDNDKESGVRDIKSFLSMIYNGINFYRLISIDGNLPMKMSYEIPNFNIPYTITEDYVNQIYKTIGTINNGLSLSMYT